MLVWALFIFSCPCERSLFAQFPAGGFGGSPRSEDNRERKVDAFGFPIEPEKATKKTENDKATAKKEKPERSKSMAERMMERSLAPPEFPSSRFPSTRLPSSRFSDDKDPFGLSRDITAPDPFGDFKEIERIEQEASKRMREHRERMDRALRESNERMRESMLRDSEAIRSMSERTRIDSEALRAELDAKHDAMIARMQRSIDNNDMQSLRRHHSDFSKHFPDDKRTHYYRGIELLNEKDFEGAEREFSAARSAGIPDSDISAYMKQAIDGQKWIWTYAYIVLGIIVVWFVGMVVLYFVGIFMSNATVKTINADPNADFAKQSMLVRWYRPVVFLAGCYYYVSLPVVILLSIALPLTIVYGALSLSALSFPIIAIVSVAGCAGILTASTGLRASFARVEKHEIERKVSREEAPELWRVVNEVAKTVGTRPVDEIWLLGTTDVAVTERGTFGKRMSNRARRVLVLGTAGIEKMDQSAFRAILAHEYGHFLNRDTAGGDISIRVNASMQKYIEGLSERRIYWWDVGAHFLKIYYKMFNRMTFGASRLQEVMADRVAAKAYGATAFERGLKHVIRRDIEESVEVTRRFVIGMLGNNRYVSELDNDRFSPMERERIVERFDEALDRTSTKDDTHPSPKERFRIASRLNEQGKDANAKTFVWDLFAKPKAIQEEMQKELREFIVRECKVRKMINSIAIGHLSQLMHVTHDPNVVIERAELHTENGDYQKSLADLDSLIHRGEKHTKLYMFRSDMQRRLGDIDGAINSLNSAWHCFGYLSAEEQTKELQIDYHFTLGRCFDLKSEFDYAREAYLAAGALDNHSYPITFRLGRLEMRAGNLSKALEYLNHASELCKGAAEPYYYRGVILARQKQFKSAAQQFRFGATLDLIDTRCLDALKKLKLLASKSDQREKAKVLDAIVLADD